METDEDREARRAYVREQMRRWRANPENYARELERNRQYLKNNRAKRNESVRRYRERKKDDPLYKAQQSKNARASYKRLRQKLFDAYGNACACCGETERAFFELDHVHGGGVREYRERGEIQLYRYVIRSGFPPIYRILCANCNRGRQRNGGVCPHELNGGFRRKTG